MKSSFEELVKLLEKVKKILESLLDVSKKMLLEETAKVHKVLGRFKTLNTAKINKLFYAEVVVTPTRLELWKNKKADNMESMWRWRLHCTKNEIFH